VMLAASRTCTLLSSCWFIRRLLFFPIPCGLFRVAIRGLGLHERELLFLV
jgi:hypothetical protein